MPKKKPPIKDVLDSRAALLSATEALMRAEGLLAVTARRVAGVVGVKHQLIYYYFNTFEDLVVEAYRNIADEGLKALATAVEGDRPLRALWRFARESMGAAVSAETIAAAGQNEALRIEIVKQAERFRVLQMRAMEVWLEKTDLNRDIPPVVAVMFIMGLVGLQSREKKIGLTMGHAKADAYIESLLIELEGKQKAAPAAPRRRRKSA